MNVKRFWYFSACLLNNIHINSESQENNHNELVGGAMVSALDSGASDPGSSLGRGHCVVFLGKTLYSHSASLNPGV